MPTLVQQGFYDGVPVQGVEVLLLLAQVPQVLHRVRLAHAADCSDWPLSLRHQRVMTPLMTMTMTMTMTVTQF